MLWGSQLLANFTRSWGWIPCHRRCLRNLKMKTQLTILVGLLFGVSVSKNKPFVCLLIFLKIYLQFRFLPAPHMLSLHWNVRWKKMEKRSLQAKRKRRFRKKVLSWQEVGIHSFPGVCYRSHVSLRVVGSRNIKSLFRSCLLDDDMPKTVHLIKHSCWHKCRVLNQMLHVCPYLTKLILFRGEIGTSTSYECSDEAEPTKTGTSV